LVLTNLSQTYDGTAKSVSATTTPAGLTNAVTYNGSASAPTNAGSYTVIGTVSSSDYTGGATNTLVISRALQTIAFAPFSDVVFGDAPLTLNATASTGLAVTYGSSAPAVGTVSNSTVFLLSPGSTTITASQAGNGNYLATNATQLLVVEPFVLNLSIAPGPVTNRVISTAILTVNGNTNRAYTIIYNTDITVAPTNWPVLQTTNLPASPFELTVPTSQTYRFYRLERTIWTP